MTVVHSTLPEPARRVAGEALQDTLVTTQRLAEDMKESARREAQLLVREAELRGEKMLEEVRAEEARIRSEIKALRRTQRELVEDLKATLERYQRLFVSELPPEVPDEDGSEG